MKENGRTVRCPKCGSDKVIVVRPFDYWKMCMNDNCVYHLDELRKNSKWRWQFSTGVHN